MASSKAPTVSTRPKRAGRANRWLLATRNSVRRFLDVPWAQMFALLAGGFASVAGMLSNYVPSMLKMPITVLLLLGALFWLLSIRSKWHGDQDKRWHESIALFEQHLRGGFASWWSLTAIDWERSAKASRWPPYLDEAPIREWSTIENLARLSTAEHLTLEVARDVYLAGRPGQSYHKVTRHPFHDSRAVMTRVIDDWVKWDAPRFRIHIGPFVEMHRNVLVMLAFLEIALAENGSKDNRISEWSRLGRLWPEFFLAPEKPLAVRPIDA